MADTVSIILDYLQRHHFAKAAAALREEVTVRQRRNGSPVSPGPDASDMDVMLYLQMSQERHAASAAAAQNTSQSIDLETGATAGEETASKIGAAIGPSGGLFQGTESRNGHLPTNRSSETEQGRDELTFTCSPQRDSALPLLTVGGPSLPPIPSPSPTSFPQWTNGIAAELAPSQDPLSRLGTPHQAGGGSFSEEEPSLLERDSTLRLEPPPEADLPRLPPVRLRSIDRNLDSTKAVEAASLGLDVSQSSVENLSGRFAQEGSGAGRSEGTGGFPLAGEGEGSGKASTGFGSAGLPGVITLGPVVLGLGAGQIVSSETLGNRRLRGSISHGIVEADDATEPLAGVSADGEAGAGMGTEATGDFPENDWDSDTYEDDEDMGYIRQPIEDEEWFLANEIDYPSDEERGRLRPVEIEQRQLVKPETSTDPPPPEDDVYFSGEEYYQGQTERRRADNSASEEVGAGGGGQRSSLDSGSHERHHRRRSQGGSTWEGLLAQVSHHRNEEEDELDGEEEDDDIILDGARSVEARSVAVTGSDVAEAGSSMRESLLGGSSEGDVDSTKGGPSSSLLGRRPMAQQRTGGSEGDTEDGESGEREEDVEQGDGEGSKERREGGEGAAEESREPEGAAGYYNNVWRHKLASKEGTREMAREEGGGGGFGGFSFPSPSSGDGLSRMDSGRSMWSVGDHTPERSANEDGDDVISSVVSGPDDTLANWKRKSEGSSPVLSPRHGTHRELVFAEEEGSFRRKEEEVVGARLQDAGREVGKLVTAEREKNEAAKPAKEVPQDDTLSLAQTPLSCPPEVTEIEGGQPQLTGERRGESSGSGTVTPVEVEEFEVIEPEFIIPNTLLRGISGADGEAFGEEEVKEIVDIGGDKEGKTSAKEMVEQEDLPKAEGDLQQVDQALPEVEEVEKVEESPLGDALLESDSHLSLRSRYRPDDDEFETFNLKIIHRRNRTGFEEEKEFPVVINSVIAGRYHVTEYLGSAAFSKAIQAHDLQTGMDVCMKIIKNNKDFFDQSLDEVKLLKYINKHDPQDKHHILRLYDYFYHREHLFIVCELLRANLYEFHKYNRESGGEVYFTLPRLQSISRQCLEALQFLHSLGLIHCDLKPENILVKSYSRCEVKVIDLGSSCFETDHLCSYVQSRSYRAPEVILGLPYGQKIDIWSLGCILAELCSGQVLFQNDSLATLLARVVGILGPVDPELLAKGRDTHKYFTKNHMLYERNAENDQLEYLLPKKTSLKHRLPMGDSGFIDFVGHLLHVSPERRPTAAEALRHPWLSYNYDSVSS